MQGSYDMTLVFASYCVSVIASFTAIYFGTRLFDVEGSARRLWLAGGALCMGSGIWTTHFVGMSAYTMPYGMSMSFSLGLTVLSWVPAVLASALALFVIAQKEVRNISLAASAIIMGAGIASMHYGGMAAMRITPSIQYDNLWLTISIVIAVVASGAALIITRQVRNVPAQHAVWVKTGAALIMGLAICGMHYSGMEAAIYAPDASMASDNVLRGNWMGIPTAIVGAIMLLLALLVALEDFRRLEQQKKAKEVREAWIDDAVHKDMLTGLANRQHFEQLLVRKIATSLPGDQFSLIYVELDKYRDLLTSKGEATANQFIKDCASAVDKSLPGPHVLSRFSMGSFMAAVPYQNAEQLEIIAHKLRTSLGGHAHTREYGSWTLGFSHYPQTSSNGRMLINQARQRRQQVDYNNSHVEDTNTLPF